MGAGMTQRTQDLETNDLPLPAEDPERPSLPAGHPVSWGALTSGTILEGTQYPLPVFL